MYALILPVSTTSCKNKFEKFITYHGQKYFVYFKLIPYQFQWALPHSSIAEYQLCIHTIPLMIPYTLLISLHSFLLSKLKSPCLLICPCRADAPALRSFYLYTHTNIFSSFRPFLRHRDQNCTKGSRWGCAKVLNSSKIMPSGLFPSTLPDDAQYFPGVFGCLCTLS